MPTNRGGKEAPNHRILNSNLRKTVKIDGKPLREVRRAAVLGFLWALVRKLKTRVREVDQTGLYKHLTTRNLKGKRGRSSAYIKDENGIHSSDAELIHERWVRRFHALRNAKSPKIDPNIVAGLDQ